MNGAGLLSAFACAAWLFVEPPPQAKGRKQSSYRDWCGVFVIVLFSFGSIAHGVLDMASCRDATQQPLQAIFHNRWNVFAGAEDHVTWEIMPARTHSGAIVDLWSQPVWKSTSVSGAPDNSSLSHLAAMARLSWLGRAARNRHRHAIEQASHRWRGGRRDDSA